MVDRIGPYLFLPLLFMGLGGFVVVLNAEDSVMTLAKEKRIAKLEGEG